MMRLSIMLALTVIAVCSGCRNADFHQLRVGDVTATDLTFTGGSVDITADLVADDPGAVTATLRIEDADGTVIDNGDMSNTDGGTLRFTSTDLPSNPSLQEADQRYVIVIEATDDEGRSSIRREPLIVPAIRRPPPPPSL